MATQQPQTGQTKAASNPEAQTGMQRKSGEAATPVRGELSRPRGLSNPFALMKRLSEDMDRLFSEFWGGSSLMPSPAMRFGGFGESWWPAIDVYQRENKLVVQADLPGLEKDDVKVEVRDGHLCISGERRSESEHREEGYHRTERSSGYFSRAIALPDDVKTETASATFEKGVLKVELEVPAPAQSKARVIEVREGKAN